MRSLVKKEKKTFKISSDFLTVLQQVIYPLKDIYPVSGEKFSFYPSFIYSVLH